MRFSCPVSARYRPVLCAVIDFEDLSRLTGLRPRSLGTSGNNWLIVGCRIETIRLALAKRTEPEWHQTFILMHLAEEVHPSVARSIVLSALDQAGGNAQSIGWYDASYVGLMTESPSSARIHNRHAAIPTGNTAFAETFTDYISASPLLAAELL